MGLTMTDLKENPNLDERCCVTVYGSNAFHHARCSRKGRYLGNDGKAYCKQHHPVTQKARDDAWNKKFRHEQAERQHGYSVRGHRDSAIAVIEKIARGDNDPRTTAQEFLDELQRLVDLPIEHYIRKD